MRVRAAFTAVTATALIIGAAGTGLAQASTTTSGGFEGFAYGDINGQQGWQKTGPYDVAISDPSAYGVSDMGAKALRISSAATSGSFGDQTFSAPLTDEAGETGAQSDGWSGGNRQRVFSASFAIRTTSPDQQPGLHVSVSPDRGDGARMSYLRFEDQADGVHVFFDDYSHARGDFTEADVAILSRSAKHTIGLTMVFVDGPSNDIVRVEVDGHVVRTGTSWEDYFRDVEGNPTRTVDSLLFRESGGAAGTAGSGGFLVDDVDLSSGNTVPCIFATSGATMTLLSDCSTSATIDVPQDFTLDGAGHTITAVDPPSGHFTGAVVQNAGSSASVKNLGVTADHLQTACDAFPASLAGIRLDGASGSVTNSRVTGLQQGASGDGCQEGDAIEVRNTAGTGTTSVTVSGNTVSAYQKTGILASGQVAATITGNTVAGYGPVDFIAQNGVQISYGATAQLTGNSISGNYYTPSSYEACGVIIYQADGVRQSKNSFSGNEKDLCNIARGGGKFGGV